MDISSKEAGLSIELLPSIKRSLSDYFSGDTLASAEKSGIPVKPLLGLSFQWGLATYVPNSTN